jgi:hypothetical protein
MVTVLSTLLFSTDGAKLKVITLSEKDIIDREELLEKNEIFYRNLKGLDMDEHNHLYYLAGHFVRIFKVDMDSLKLIKTISEKGQGPSELHTPLGFSVRNNRIFVYDMGFPGIKIFDTNGGCEKEIKFHDFKVFSLNIHIEHLIDANDKNEIYLRDIDEKNNTAISVFDLEGKRIKTMIPINADRNKDAKLWILNTNFKFKLDNDGNIIILYLKKGLLKKLDKNGALIWERDLYVDLPQADKTPEKFEVVNEKRRFQFTVRLDFMGFCIAENNDIFVSSHKGGFYYDKSGKPLFILKQPSGKGFGTTLLLHKKKLITPDKVFRLNYTLGEGND